MTLLFGSSLFCFVFSLMIKSQYEKTFEATPIFLTGRMHGNKTKQNNRKRMMIENFRNWAACTNEWMYEWMKRKKKEILYLRGIDKFSLLHTLLPFFFIKLHFNVFFRNNSEKTFSLLEFYLYMYESKL